MEKKVIYYQDELNDDFADNNIKGKAIDSNYRYINNSWLFKFNSFWLRNLFAIPVLTIAMLFMYRPKIKNKEILKGLKKKGYYIYANHVLPLDPIIIPVKANPGKACVIISSHDAFSINPVVTWLIKHFYTIPIPNDKEMFDNYVNALSWHINKRHRVLIFPEAHIWPYYTGIRPFTSASFRYPVTANKPVICLTNTYLPKDKKWKRCRLVTHIDGPFYPDPELSQKEAAQKLRDEVYECMIARSQEKKQFEHYRYIDLSKIEEK